MHGDHNKISRDRYVSSMFCCHFYNEKQLVTSYLFPLMIKSVQDRSSLEGKNLLPEEQLLTFVNLPPFGRETKTKILELLCLTCAHILHCSW